MKKIISIGIVALFAISISAFSTTKIKNHKKSETSIKMPSVLIKTLNGESINSQNIISNEKPTLLIFWATCCAPCKKELSTISNVYKQWKNETGINIVAISVDIPRYANGVAPFVKNNKWDFDVYLDVERNLMHKMNATSTPHSFLISKTGEIVWEKQGFTSGDELDIIKKIKELI
ncbi:TlpA family protein disulfide reductase [Aquimarina megaterium]|uniref:TlpA family protein disulfide reductase n=1 Tax=Aquimarina megaterium TaxID=1443666 RepID=UPI000471AE3D|nr:TlpA disulfide reductase family protein [Aquimarina megaterium]